MPQTTPHFLVSPIIPRHPLCPDAGCQESHGFGGVGTIGQVGCSDDQAAGAHEISNSAEDPGLLTREVGDLATILEVLGVTEGDRTNDLVLDGGGSILNSTVDKGCALTDGLSATLYCGHSILPVSSYHDLGVRASACGGVE